MICIYLQMQKPYMGAGRTAVSVTGSLVGEGRAGGLARGPCKVYVFVYVYAFVFHNMYIHIIICILCVCMCFQAPCLVQHRQSTFFELVLGDQLMATVAVGPNNSVYLVEPWEYHVQEPNIPCGESLTSTI